MQHRDGQCEHTLRLPDSFLACCAVSDLRFSFVTMSLAQVKTTVRVSLISPALSVGGVPSRLLFCSDRGLFDLSLANLASIWLPLIFVVCTHTFIDLRSPGRLCWHISWVPSGGADEPYSSISRGFHSSFHGVEALSDMDVVHVGSYFMDSRGFSPRSFLVWCWRLRRRTSVLFFSRWLSVDSLVASLPFPVPLVILEHGVTTLSACALDGCIGYFTGLPHAVPVRPSRLPPGSVLCPWPVLRVLLLLFLASSRATIAFCGTTSCKGVTCF